MNCIMNNTCGKTRKSLIPKEAGEPLRLLPAPQAEIRVDGDNNIYPVQQLAKARAQLLADVRGSEGHTWTILKAKLGILPGGQATRCVGDELASVWIPDLVPHVQWSAPVRLVTASELKALGVSLGEAAAEPPSVPQSEGGGGGGGGGAQTVAGTCGGGAQTVAGTGSEAMSTRQHKAPTPLSVLQLNNSAADKETSGIIISAPERRHKIEMEPAQDDSCFDAGAAVSSRKRKLEGANDSDTCIMPLPKTAFVTPPTVSVTDRDVVDICCNSSDDNTQSTDTNDTVASTSNCNVKGKGIHTSVTMPDVIDIDGSSDNSDDNTQSTIAENTVTSTVNTRGKREGIICTSVTVSVSPDVIYLTDSANDRSHSNTESICTENTVTNKAHVEREGTGKAAAGSHGTASVNSSVKGSDGVRNSTSKGENAHTRNSHGNGEGRSASATVAATSVVVDLEGASRDSADVVVITENTRTKAGNTITTDGSRVEGRDARLKNPAPPTDSSIASTLSRAVSELSGCLNEPFSAGISYSVVRQKQQGSSDPLSKTHRMFSEAVLAEEHARYVWMEQQGQVGNADPRKVAALDMWERKALREMGLVDCLPVTVAHDADGNAIFTNESLEVINGLVFFKLAVLLRGSRYGEGSPARVTLPALMDGQLGGIAFRCDYCAFCTDQDILPHLMKVQHPSGSSVLNFTEKGKEGKARCIVVPSLIKAPAPFSKHVPVCPVCHAVFDDIMDCVSHTYTHGGITGVYQLRLVTRIKTVTIAKTIKCSTCKEVFANVATLLEHWIQANHAQLDGEEMAVIYCCQSSGNCRFRSGDIGQTCQHILNRHIQGGRGGEMKGIAKAVYLGGPTPIRRLMPFFPMSCVDINPAASADDVRAGVQERKDNASPGDCVSVTPTDSRCVNGRDTKTGSTSSSTSFGRSQQRGEDTENKALLSEDSGVNRAANADGVSTDAHKDSVPRQSKLSAAGINTANTDTPKVSLPYQSKPAAGINTANTDTPKVSLLYQSKPAAGINTANTDTPKVSLPYQSKPAAGINTANTDTPKVSLLYQSKPAAGINTANTDTPKVSLPYQSKPAAGINTANKDTPKVSLLYQSKPAAGIDTARTDTPEASVPSLSKPSAAGINTANTDTLKVCLPYQSEPAAGIDTGRTDTPKASVPYQSKPSATTIDTVSTALVPHQSKPSATTIDTVSTASVPHQSKPSATTINTVSTASVPHQSKPSATTINTVSTASVPHQSKPSATTIDTVSTASVPHQSKLSATTIDTVSTASVPHQSKPSATTTVAASTDSPKAFVLHQSKASAATIDAASTDSAKASVPHQSKPPAAGIHTVRTDTPKVSAPYQSKSSVADTNAAGGQSVDTDIVLWGTASAGDVSDEQIAAEHERYLEMERQGLICNAEPNVVAGLDMLERKTLRDMGLVDVVRPAVAHDADGQPIPLDNSLEVIHGLAFLKLFAVLRNTSEETTGTRLKTATLMKGSLGDLAYKCDYCTEVFGTAEDLLPHLETARHPTGSTVLRRRESPRKPRCIIAPSSVTHPPSVFQSLVAVCPVCEAVFEEIMDCVAHTHAHGGTTGVYQLRRVLSQKDISVTKTMECCVCGAGFPGVAALLEHWRDTQHVQLEREKETIVFFLCRCSSDCHYRSSEPEQVLQHVLREHLEGGQCVKGMVKGVCLGGPTPFKRLMPFFPVHRLDNDEPLWKLRHLDFHSSFVGRCTESSTVVTATLSTASATSLNQPGTSSAVVSRPSSPFGANISSTLLQSSKAPVTNMTSVALSLNKPSCANSSTALLGNKPSRANSSTALLGNKPSRANSSTAHLGNKPSCAKSSMALLGNKPSRANSSTALLGNKPSHANSSTALLGNKPSVANSSTADLENKLSVANSLTADLGNKPSVANSSTVHVENKPSVASSSTAHLENKPSGTNGTTAHLVNKPSNTNSSTAHLENKPSVANSSTVHAENKPSVSNSSTAHVENKPSVSNSSTAHVENKPSVSNSSTAHVEDKPSVANSSTAHVEDKPSVANSSTAHLAENKPAGADPSSALPRSGFNGSFSPLSTVRAMSADLVAKEHEHYLSLERRGHIRNEEPSMVAALSMWERKALRLLGLVDQAVTVVAFDDACEPVPLDDSKLELHRGLAFIRLDALQRDCAHSTTQTRIKTKALLSNSMFGGISHRCDYCSEMFSSEECLLTHLRDRKHSSGSTVLRWPRKKKTARCIIVPSSARHPPSFFESFVPVCPVCHAAFGEIMDCVAHTYTHGGITGVYQLRQVCKTEVFVVTEDFQCTRCGTVFCSVAKLQEHWQRTKHIQLVSQKQTFVIYCCHSGNDCYFHSDDFQQAYLHALNQHLRLGQGKEGKSWIKAVYLEQQCPVRRLLPFFPVHCLDVDPSLSSDTSGSQNSQCLNGGQSTPASAAVQYGQHSAR